jgi:hypothetical protein
MGMMTAASDQDYASEMLCDLDEPTPDDYDEDAEADQQLDIEREERE